MGDHIHHKGGFMASYRFMRMDMSPNYDGTDELSTEQVFADYPVAPTRMTMDMHMLGLMYAPSDRVTLSVMLPFVVVEMQHARRADGLVFSTKSSGIGDVGVAALVKLFARGGNLLILDAGMTFPTGSIDREDVTPISAPDNGILPYPMQLGSGTWDLRPGLTYTGALDRVSWGAQAMGTFRMGRNEQNYRLGHAYSLTGWGAWKVAEVASVSARLAWQQWFDIDGMDSRLDQTTPPLTMVVPTADPGLRAGRRLEVGPGVNFVVPGTPLEGVRLAFEMLFPVYRSLDGPQLGSDWTLIVGTQYAW
jgi:hypothetical protein